MLRTVLDVRMHLRLITQHYIGMQLGYDEGCGHQVHACILVLSITNTGASSKITNQPREGHKEKREVLRVLDERMRVGAMMRVRAWRQRASESEGRVDSED